MAPITSDCDAMRVREHQLALITSECACLQVANELPSADLYDTLDIPSDAENFTLLDFGSQDGGFSRRRDCHFTGIPSPSILIHLIKVEGCAAE